MNAGLPADQLEDGLSLPGHGHTLQSLQVDVVGTHTLLGGILVTIQAEVAALILRVGLTLGSCSAQHPLGSRGKIDVLLVGNG